MTKTPEETKGACPVLSVVGRKNSGKTTLTTALIAHFKAAGYRVGAIKHDAHNFEIDHEGKDSWRMTQAGAEKVVIASQSKLAMIQQLDGEQALETIIDSLMHAMDIILVEGYKKEHRLKIEITRTGDLVCGDDPCLLAIVANNHPDDPGPPAGEFPAPCFGLEQIDALAAFTLGKLQDRG